MTKIILFCFLISTLVCANTKKSETKKINTFLKSMNIKEELIVYTTHTLFNDKAYHVRTNKSEFIVSKDFKTFFPVKNSLFKKVNKDWKPYFIPQDLTRYKKDSFFSIGEGDFEIYAFISPNCDFCNKLYLKLSQTPSILKKYTIYFYFLIKNDEKAKTLAHILLDSKNRQKEYLMISKNKYNPQFNFIRLSAQKRAAYSKIIEKNFELASQLGAIGTPALFTKNAEPFKFSKKDFTDAK